MATPRVCSIPDCGKPQKARSFCEAHYQAKRKAGMPTRRHAAKGEGQAFVEAAHLANVENCVLWPFSARNTYGTMRVGALRIQPHRYACILQNGPPQSDDLVARHTCNVKRCVNPRHMLWGTNQDNMDDKVRCGTCTRGEDINAAKLSADDVLTIRASKETHVALAKRYGVSVTSIFNVRNRLTWKHI